MENPYSQIIQLLKDNNIDYQEIEHEPVYTSEQAEKVTGISEKEGAKSLLIKADSDFILAVLPGSKRLDAKKLKKLLGVKSTRFANPEEVKEIMGCEIGACYPFGNIINLKTIFDNSVTKNEQISFNPGAHDKTIRIKWKDFQNLYKFELTDISE